MKVRVRATVKSVALATALTAGLAGCAGSNGDAAKPEVRFRVVRATVASEMIRDNREMTVLDVRSSEEFYSPAGHLPRAVSTPLAELGRRLPRLDLAGEATVIVYSGDGGREQEEAATFLIERGQRFVFQIEGGLEGWLDRGFPVEVEEPVSPTTTPRSQEP